MEDVQGRVGLIVGAGSGLSASLARLLAAHGVRLALAARRPEKLEPLAAETGALALPCDAAEPTSVAALFEAVDDRLGAPEVVIYNPSYRSRGPFVDLEYGDVERSVRVTALGGFLVAQAAARRMLPNGRGAILFTGASASIKGYARSAPFAMGKFALRGMAQSMARELAPQGIHVAHLVIDGAIGRGANDDMLDPDAIAETYLSVLRQPRSAWSWEIELRPWVETF